jgi:hypothetical protein
MMSLPFFAQAVGFVAIILGFRRMAVGFWAVSVMIMLILFKLHANDALAIGL